MATSVWTPYPSLARVLCRIRRGERLRVRTGVAQRRVGHPQARFDPQAVEAVEIE